MLLVWIIIILAVSGESIIRKAGARFSGLDEEIASAQEKLIRLNAILKQEKALNEEYDNALSGYKPVKGSDALLQEINAIAKRLNVNITNIKPLSTKEEAAFQEYSIKIEGQDDVYAIARFLNVLIGELKSVSIVRAQFNAQNRDELPKINIIVNALALKP